MLRDQLVVLIARQRVRWNTGLKRHKAKLRLGVITLTFLLSAVFTGLIEDDLLLTLSTKEGYALLTNLLVGLGCAMAGATAIVFTLVQFATQTNVARMPTELFRMFSSDATLLSAFLGTMALAVAVAASSLIASPSSAVWQLFGAAWAVMVILLIFVLAYERALNLINPSVQARVAALSAQKSLGTWGTLADKLASATREALPMKWDAARYAFFAANVGWERDAQSILRQLVPYGAKLAEQGDHDSFVPILDATVAVHRTYVRVKGRTFIADNLLLGTVPTREPFQLSTLEDLRRVGLAALAKRDERQAMFVYQTLQRLFIVYLEVEYGQPSDSKTHAALVAGYLYHLVQESVSHKMPDVTMEGGRLVGQVARADLKLGFVVDFRSALQCLGKLAVAAGASRPMLPVALVVAEELRDCVTLGIMVDRHSKFEFEALHQEAIGLAALVMQGAPEASSLEGMHRRYLAPYFSVSDAGALLPRIAELMELEPDENWQFGVPSPQRLLEWMDVLRHPTKDLMLIALKLKSSLLYDLLNWPADLTKLLLGLSMRQQTPEMEGELHDMAERTLAILTWVPTDAQSLHAAEINGHLERLATVATAAGRANAWGVYASASKQMLSWGLKLSATKSGWDGLKRAVAGLTALDLKFRTGNLDGLVSRIREGVAGEPDISAETLKDAARGLDKIANSLHGRRYASSEYERLFSSLDEKLAASGLNQIAVVLTELSRGQ